MSFTSACMDDRENRSELSHDLQVRNWDQLSAEPCGAMLDMLDRVDLLEQKGVGLSQATNWTYWSLDCAYQVLCEVGVSPITSLFRS